MYFYILFSVHIIMVFLWFILKDRYHWSPAGDNVEHFFEEEYKRLNVQRTFDHFMGRVDPYKEVKEAVRQLDRHFNDTYMYRSSKSAIIESYMRKKRPNITPEPNLEEVIINTSLNPNLK